MMTARIRSFRIGMSAALVMSPPLAGIALADSDTTDSGQLEEIIVTAQKRSEAEIKVPISMMAIDQQTMDKQGVKDISDIARLVPGLTYGASDDDGDTSISIRGISSDVGSATTGIYIDDTPVQARPEAVATNPYPKIFDLDRVEVLRGPQGTLFGAGSEGGTVRFITPEPSLTQFSGFGRVAVEYTDGGDPSWESGVAMGGPIIPGKIGFRFSGWYRDEGGWIDRIDPATGQTADTNTNKTGSTVVKLSFKIAPTDQFIIEPSVYYQDVRQDDLSLYWESVGPFNERTRIPQPTNDHFVLPSLSLEYDFDAFSVKSITSYLKRAVNNEYDSTNYVLSNLLPFGTMLPTDPNFLVKADYYESQLNFSQEFRFTSNDSGDSPISWVGGLFYLHARSGANSLYGNAQFDELSDYLSQYYGYGPGNTEFYFGEPLINGQYSYIDHFIETETDMAAFGNITYAILPELKLSAGLRVARSGFTYFDASDGPWGPAAYTQFSGSEKETPVTPRFNITYQFDPDQMVYATAAKGYRIGGANEPVPVGNYALDPSTTCSGDLAKLGLTQVPESYNSDSTWSYEVGAKGKFLDNKVLLEASLYWIDWSNIQEEVYLPTCSYYYISNLGQVASRGFDVQAEWQVSKELVLSGTAGLTDARYTKTLIQEGQILAKDGDSLAQPEWTATLSAEYTTQILADTEGFARLDYEFSGSYDREGSSEVFGVDPTLRFAPATHYVSARLGVKRGAWDVELYGDNLLNADPSLFRYRDTPTTYDYRDTTFRPLTIGLQAEMKF
jgi:outer membrane receptor protein involved in Fe transport